ncbi:MAG: hypothetical protein AAB354_16115 [candidate division KSB1 bacterium]
MNQPYHPIACALHDELEALATLRRACRIVFRDDNDQTGVVAEVIADIFVRDREEFVRLRNGMLIRLDHIVSIDDKPFAPTCRPS